MTLTIHLRASGRTIVRYPRNQYAAARSACALLRTYRTDTKIRKTVEPGKILFRHRETGDVAIITLEDDA